MTNNNDTDEVFDEEELAEGFEEEIVDGEDPDVVDGEEIEIVDDEADDVVSGEDEEVLVAVIAVEDDEDVTDDADVELALDEVLAETIRRTTVPEDDDETPGEVETGLDLAEVILPKQDDEFRCASCRLLKKTSQLANGAKMLCRDCV